MFSRLLIANRGEIALRVIRACKELGIESVAVYSKADENAAYLQCADHTVCIGPGPSKESYLDISRIVSAAEVADVDAIHPGYGFLAENPHFAEVCRSCKIEFIGPSSEAIAMMGNKVAAREVAKKSGVPVIPGSSALVASDAEALDVAHAIGYPVMIKAAMGGGGRGMRVAHNDMSLTAQLKSAQAEAENAFKDASVYIEKFIEKARHVEFQILGDNHGRVIHLGERDCTLQRRNQKLIEEAPSPFITPAMRKEMGEAAVRLAKAAKYTNAGTVEFLVDASGQYYFIEMNARIQVEHPVTEMVTGVDLLKEQIRVAAGENLSISRQKDVKINGWAIECRINAEDPASGFKPSPGIIRRFIPPGGPGVRMDTHAYAGYEIPPHYDSMIGKMIVHRADRRQAILTARRALSEFVVEGVATTIPLLEHILGSHRFMNAQYDTGSVEAYFLA